MPVSWPVNTVSSCIRWPDHRGNPHIRVSRILAPVRPRTQAAGLQCLKPQIAVASTDPQTRTFPGTQAFWNTRSPKFLVLLYRQVSGKRGFGNVWCSLIYATCYVTYDLWCYSGFRIVELITLRNQFAIILFGCRFTSSIYCFRNLKCRCSGC